MTVEMDVKSIDINKLTKEEQRYLLFEILKSNTELYTDVKSVVSNEDEEISMAYIDKIINQDFERYDEVFRKLA